MAETSGIAGIPTRRTVVAGVGAAGLAAALTACGSSNDSSGSVNNAATPAQGGSSGSSSAASGGGSELAQTTDIPQGGGKVFEAQKVVVTQPSSGQFKAFSAVCPHQGCLVNDVSGGTINCPCHGSKFSVTDGSVKNGPATSGLAAANVSVDGTSIKLA
jgi:nitrite reductase/ring-hydroxylating ferredoxin subunit